MRFISDLHLSPERPGISRLFLDYLAHVAPEGKALCILGDLFEAWIGDDDRGFPYHAQIIAALRAYSASAPLLIMRGNRDFLLGEDFAMASGATLIDDPFLAAPGLLVSHGDAWCTQDAAYTAFRTQVRSRDWQQQFLAKPLAERRQIAEALRAQSEREKRHKDMALMDVTPQALAEAFRTHGYPVMVHGHTHRPGQHRHDVDGHECQRWVLSDWREEGTTATADCLYWDGSNLRREPLTGRVPSP